MRKYITIGELAALFEVKTTKIRFYERKGLMTPEEISESGYRLYSFDDLERLEIILLLREMDVPLDKIKDLLKGYSKEDYKHLLNNLKNDTKQQILKMKQKLKMIDERLEHLKNYNHNDIRILTYPERRYAVIEENISKDSSVKNLYDTHSKYNLRLSNYGDRYIIVINEDSTINKGVMNKALIARSKNIQTIPKGSYLEIKRKISLFKDSRDNIKSIYEFIHEKGYEVEGNLYGIEDYRLFLFSNIADYYTFEIKLKDE